MKYSDIDKLSNSELDFYVAESLGWYVTMTDGTVWYSQPMVPGIIEYSPSTEWRDGGRLIEELKISVEPITKDLWSAEMWTGQPGTADDKFTHGVGKTPLIAVCKCIVAAKYGESDEIRQYEEEEPGC